MNLRDYFGNLDIYLFDQLLKNRVEPSMRILDAGCGGGRNLVYFLRNGYAIYGVDEREEAVEAVRRLARELAPALPADHFAVAGLDALPYDDARFDLVICSAVLHFARDTDHFEAMLHELWRVVKPGGFFFARLASSIGIEDRIEGLGEGRYALPDGTDRYLVDQERLLDYAAALGATLLDPIKTTIVQGRRAMTTWVLRKDAAVHAAD